jgi:hypothetical protein
MKINLYNLTLEKTLQEVERLSKKYCTDLEPLRDLNLKQIFEYVSKKIEYKKDPEGIELVKRPGITLRQGNGDCDDKTVVVLAYCYLKGIPAGYSIVGSSGSYHHIFPFILNSKNEKFDFDATYNYNVYGQKTNWLIRKDFKL